MAPIKAFFCIHKQHYAAVFIFKTECFCTHKNRHTSILSVPIELGNMQKCPLVNI